MLISIETQKNEFALPRYVKKNKELAHYDQYRENSLTKAAKKNS